MIREQATEILQETNLIAILEKYGNVMITGSYRMDMMCWNDIDLYIEDCDTLRDNWFSLIHDVMCALQPYRFDGFHKTDKLFLGCEAEFNGSRWNVDIWVRDRKHMEQAEAYCNNIVRKVTAYPEMKTAIIDIKNELIARRMYGIDKMAAKHYHSDEIYRAVLDEGIRMPEEFMERYPK